jgi:CHRD domain-containing protein
MRKLRIRTYLMAGLAIATLLYAGSWVGADGNRHRFKARLHGFNEVPAVSSTGSGEFKATIREDAVDWELSYQGLEGTPTTASHIHFGQKDVNGGVSVFFCGGATTPACTPGSGTFNGTFTAADVGGPAAQGIAAGEFSELVAAIRAGKTYVNVHTNKHPGGEIRGQVHGGHDDDDDDN